MPHARTTDPSTSHEAARSLTAERLSETQRVILELLRNRQLTDEEIQQLHYAGAEQEFWNHASPSGLRSRRAELVARGFVEEVGRAKTKFGRNTIIWGQVA